MTKRELQNILNIDAPVLPLPNIDIVKTMISDAESWVSLHADNIDDDSEECLVNYLESQSYCDYPNICEVVANNAFYREGFQ